MVRHGELYYFSTVKNIIITIIYDDDVHDTHNICCL
jgi:hypothetical protein